MNSIAEKFIMRAAKREDVNSLADLAARSFRDAFASENTEEDIDEYIGSAFSIEKIEKDFQNASNVFLVACSASDGQPVGYAKLRKDSRHSSVDSASTIELERLYADSSVIGKGVGKALMLECVERAHGLGYDTLWLGVWERNHRAIQFYERHGFSTVGEQEFKLGSDIQNDLIMCKALNG